MRTTNRSIHRTVLVLLLLVGGSWCLYPQAIEQMEFRDQKITDILLVLAEASGTSIIPDETVTGSASYFFSETEFDRALEVFLETYKLYLRHDNGIYYVSRIRSEYDTQNDKLIVDAEDVNIATLIKAISKSIGKTILFDSLPPDLVTIHAKEVAPAKVLEILTAKYGVYEITADPDYFYIRRKPQEEQESTVTSRARPLVERSDAGYSINIEKARFREVLASLFELGEREYSLLTTSDTLLQELEFTGKGFDELLRLILDHVDSDFTTVGDVYYIFEITRRDILKRLDSTVRVPLTHLSAEQLPNLLPGDLLTSNLFKIDRNTNSVILRGSLEEIAPIQEFLALIDVAPTGRNYRRFELETMNVEELASLLPNRFASAQIKAIPNSTGFVAMVSDEQAADLSEYLALVDRDGESVAIKLKYLNAEELVTHLPPSVSDENIITTGDPSLIFFSGSDSARGAFQRELEWIDQPVPQIRYDLLVIQYQHGENDDFSYSFENQVLQDGATSAFLGSIGQLLGLNLNIVSTFGYMFAIKLNVDIGTDRASVLADTTLNGISGQRIKFQNTNTYRYRDAEIDPDTGSATDTGVTREITSGLIIEIDGWVSGNDVITMDVSATVSKQGADTSGTSTGSLPTTSEKVVSTHVRTASGEPVVIGGLIQQDYEERIKKIPLLGDIPWVGKAFQQRTGSLENTELAIYIVPHVEYPDYERISLDARLEELYTRFVESE